MRSTSGSRPARARSGVRRGRACRTACRAPRCCRSTRVSRELDPSTWEDPSLVQVWGPRFSTYVVPARDHAVFTLGRLPDDARGRRRAEDARRPLHAFLDGRRMTDGEAGRGLGVHAQFAPLRRADRHRADPLGGRARADGLDRAATRGRPTRRAPRARAPVPARLRPYDARGVRPMGRHRARAEAGGVRRAEQVADARCERRSATRGS